MIYISVDVDFSEAEAQYSDKELQQLIIAMKKLCDTESSAIDKDKLSEIEKQSLEYVKKFKVELPPIYGLEVNSKKYLSMSKPSGNVLVNPVLVEIDNYRTYYSKFCRLGNSFDSVAFGQINYPRIISQKEYKIVQEELILKFNIEGYNNGTLTAKYELPNSLLKSYIEYIASNIGLDNIGIMFPSLSKYNIKSSNTYFRVDEISQLPIGTVVYAS